MTTLVIAIVASIQAIATVVLVCVTAFYAWRTHGMLKEMEKARKAQMTPHLEVKLANLRDRAPTHYVLRIANVGPGPAKNPVVRF